MSSSEKKVVNFGEIQRYRQFDDEIVESDLEKFDEISRKMREYIVSNGKDSINSEMKKRIIQLEEENKNMKERLKNSFPTHIVLYSIVCSLLVGICIILLVLRYAIKVYTIDPYYIICTLLISLTLFFTAISAIKDWKEYINGTE